MVFVRILERRPRTNLRAGAPRPHVATCLHVFVELSRGVAHKNCNSIVRLMFTGPEAEVDIRGWNADVCQRRSAEDTLGPHGRRDRTSDISLSQSSGRTTTTCHTTATCWTRYQPLIPYMYIHGRHFIIEGVRPSRFRDIAGFLFTTPPLFHPNFGGVLVGPDRPCWS